MSYLVVGLITALYLCFSAEQEKRFFSDKLKVNSLWDALCNYRVVAAFIILTLIWPIALVKTIYSTYNK